MPSYNRVILVGNVGRDPEMRYMQSGEPIASFSLATSEKWTGKDGQKQERTDWHRCEVFGKTAKVVEQYVHKGDPVLVEGSIRYEEWTDKDGQKRNTTKIRVQNVQFLGQRREGGGGGQPAPGADRSAGGAPAPADDFQVSDDDIPFVVAILPLVAGLIARLIA